jgi:hypothetical protein
VTATAPKKRRRRGRRSDGWLSRREYALKLRCDQWGVPYGKVSRIAVFRRDGWVCQLCKEPIDPKLRYPNRMSKSLDHIKPLSWGPERSPGHVYTNCQAAHFSCNSAKQARHE